MIIDSLTEFADNVTLGTTVATHTVGDAVDLQAAGWDIGHGKPLYGVITVDTAFTSGGSATVRFQWCTDAQDPLAADGTESVHVQTGDIPVASLVQGFKICQALPQAGIDFERYLGLQAVVGTAVLTAGAVSAFLTQDPIGWKPYAEGQN